MTSLMKEIPFAETLGPILLAVALWSGVHIILIAPNIIVPRLTEKVYRPQCEAGIVSAWDKAATQEQSRLKQAWDDKRAELRHKREMAERLIDRSFGEVGQHLKKLGLLNSLDALDVPDFPEPTKAKPNHKKLNKTAHDYCGCVIKALVGNQITTGLYSASLRFWKPDTIQKLEGLGKNPVKHAQCSVPDFLN